MQKEIKVTEIISFILEYYRNEKVNQDLEVTSELILQLEFFIKDLKFQMAHKPKKINRFKLQKMKFLKK